MPFFKKGDGRKETDPGPWGDSKETGAAQSPGVDAAPTRRVAKSQARKRTFFPAPSEPAAESGSTPDAGPGDGVGEPFVPLGRSGASKPAPPPAAASRVGEPFVPLGKTSAAPASTLSDDPIVIAQAPAMSEEETVRADPAAEEASEAQTVIAAAPGSATVDGAGEPPTRLMGAGGPAARGAVASDAPEAPSDDPMADPTVGWLVVVEGPGRGRVFPLGFGLNGIGRGPDARAQLDFGDVEISRETHAAIAYDPRGRAFFVQHGGGRNLTYLDDAPVLAPTPLTAGQTLLLGQTRLRFVPLCGPDFDWGAS